MFRYTKNDNRYEKLKNNEKEQMFRKKREKIIQITKEENYFNAEHGEMIWDWIQVKLEMIAPYRDNR